VSIKAFFTAISLSALLIGGIAPAASAQELTPSQQVSGVIIQYAKGVAPISQNGQPTGANLLRGVVSSEDLGGGLYVLKLSKAVPQSELQSWVDRMIHDRRITWADLNLTVSASSVVPKDFKIPSFTKARPATGPRSLSASARVTTSAPDRARIRLTWLAPANRYGATIVGYRIQISSNNGRTYTNLISNTGTRATRIFLTDGIRSGVSYRFRVRAITNDGSGTDTVGSISNTVSASVRTAPKPAYITSSDLTGPGLVTFRAQSLSDRGGFAKSRIRYRAVATSATGQSFDSASCTLTSCSFPDLPSEETFKIEVLGTNPLGSASSKDVVAVDDLYFPLQWYLSGQNGVSMPSAWKYSKGDGYKVVAVIDTGIKSHPDIDKSLTRNPDGSIYGYDFVSDINSAGDGDGEDPNPNDEGGDASGGNSYHGTHVAGIIAASHDTNGTSGVAPRVKILPIRALGREGGTISDLIRAINWASGIKISNVPTNRVPVSVINLSLGARDSIECVEQYASVFQQATSRGITVVAAAGNESRASLSFPANCPGVVSVAATNSLGDRASYSNYGEGVLIAAPGGQFSIGSSEAPESQGGIISAWVDETDSPTYRLSEGTSMAAPVVSGIVALMYSMQPNISPARVRTILSNSVKAFPEGSTCLATGGCGTGLVNAHLALARTSALR
jgi:serine protease